MTALHTLGRRGRRGPVTVRFLPADEEMVPEPPRVALAVGRRVGSAVVRNRVRRRLREAMRAAVKKGNVRSGAYLLGAGPGIVELSYREVVEHVEDALRSIGALREPASARQAQETPR